jgi:lipopolysaccharide heptosyltransferase I
MSEESSHQQGKKLFRVLIVKPSSLGDIIHTFPAVSLLRQIYPEVKLDWMVNPAFESILDYCPGIDRKIIFQRRELGRISSFLPAFLKLFKSVRQEKYDLVIDFQGLMRSAFFSWLARSRKIFGPASPKETLAGWFYTCKLPESPEFMEHALEKNVYIMNKVLGQENKVPDFELPVIMNNQNSARKLLEQKGLKPEDKCIGIIPGARWESKKWPPDFFVEVISKALNEDPDFKFVILGSKDDLPAAENIIELLVADDRKKVVSLAGETSIGELVELLRDCRAVVCNDSGPMHIAAALKVPVLAMFGPTNPARTGPYGEAHQVFQPELHCINCLKRYCSGENYDCHQVIDGSELVQALLKIVREQAT